MSEASQRIFISDCEGPISKNDNAFELATHFIPQGAHFFKLISRYDDILADIVKKPGYKAGDTLKLILPFLKAYGATNQQIREYSSGNVLLVPGARHMLQHVGAIMPSFIVSTSYEQYMDVLCNFLEFPFENVYCTRLDLDRYKLTEKEEERLRQLRKEMSALPTLEIPRNAQVITDFSTQHQKALEKLDEVFWKEISSMKIGEIFSEVNPIGGYEKAEAVQNITSKAQSDLCDVMYVGDSITDVSAFRLVREVGGLTISFNGNEYAIREAEIAALSEDAVVTAILADTFNRIGKNGVIQLLNDWSHEALRTYDIDSSLRKRVVKLYPELLPQVEAITPGNRKRLSKESSAFRKTTRGEAIGSLG